MYLVDLIKSQSALKFNEFSLVMNNRYILFVFFSIFLGHSSYGKMRDFFKR